jgi:hypothetical protein
MTYAYRAPSHPGMSYPAFVDPKPPGHARAPGSVEPFPRVDDRLVRPETREERVGGQLVLAVPANDPHADQHYELDFVTRGGLAPGYVGATDLLTRVDGASDFAADTCIRREGTDPATGARYLEEVAFEVVGEQSLHDLTGRAKRIAARGVRRIIAIFVKKREVREWSTELDDWATLDPDGMLEDRTLATPIPVRALLDRAAANRAVVRALHTKRDPAILEIEHASAERGRAQIARKAIEALCEVLDHPLDAERRALLQTLDAAKLEALLDAIRTERRWP